MKVKPYVLVLTAVFFAIGMIAGFFIGANPKGLCQDPDFRFIRCDLTTSEAPVIEKHEYVGLKTRLEDLINSKSEAGEISTAAVYFRDLKNGPTMGINEYERFIPASLLKVPLLLTYLRLAENDPQILTKKLAYKGKAETVKIIQYFPSKETIEAQTPYTIDELLRRMIVYSDNKAYEGLTNYLKQRSPEIDLLHETIIDLGIVDPSGIEDEVITVKSYSSIFRHLYNSSFLESREMSEKALAILADSDFKLGISAGVPENMTVAHKFGERGYNQDQIQLHDCGVAYYPDNPYTICVMTRGKDHLKLLEIIKTISKMVYDEVNSRKL